MRRTLIVLIGLLLLLPPMAAAQDDDEFGEPGFYLGLGASFGIPRLGAVPDTLGQGSAASVGGGVQAFGGYRILPWLAVEAHLEYLAASFTLTAEAAKYRPATFTGNVKFMWPGEVRPFVSVGTGMMNAYFKGLPLSCCPQIDQGTMYGVTMRYVAGVTMGGARGGMSVTFDFSYIQPLGDLNGFDYFTIGLFKVGYHF